MKIVLTVACIHKMGGTEKATLDLANLLAMNDENEIIILSLYKNLSNNETCLNIQLKPRVTINYLDTTEVYLSKDYKYYKIKEILSVHKIKTAIEKLKPHVVIHSQIEHVKRVNGAKNINIVHTSYKACKNSKYTMLLLKKRIKQLDSIIFLNESDAQLFNEEFKTAKAKYISNSTSISIQQRTTLKNKKMIFLGRLDNNVKQIDHLIEVVTQLEQNNELNGWKLHIYGDGKDKEYLNTYIQKQNMQHCITLKGHTNKIEETLSQYDIMLLTSKYEGMPMVLLEAASSGLALISYDCSPAITNIISHGKNGYIVEQDNIGSFCENLHTLIRNEELLCEMGEKSLDVMKVKFSKTSILEMWHKELNILS